MYSLGDYLELTTTEATRQWRSILERTPAIGRQVPFVPIETLLCLAASLLINHRRYGGSTAHKAGSPVVEMATLFKRPASSILEKMRNLDGTRVNGAKWDLLAGTTLLARPEALAAIYRTIMATARAVGVTTTELPDFLEIEQGGAWQMLGQEELTQSDLERAAESELSDWAVRSDLTELEVERIVLAKARVGQHRFARDVLANCGQRCVFCGLGLSGGAGRLLLASHIKPWRDSNAKEKLDLRNGLAACPVHDVAFDSGLITVNGGLRVHLSDKLKSGLIDDPVASRYFGSPPMSTSLLLPPGAKEPRAEYLSWHKERVFAAN